MNLEIQHQQEELLSYSVKTLFLAGGRGKRLESITGGVMPKCFVTIDSEQKVRGIDHLHRVMVDANLTDVTFSADFYYDFYEKFIQEVSDDRYAMLEQTRGGGNSGAVEQFIQLHGINHQYLVISPDTYFSPHDVKKLLTQHKPGTITWGVGHYIPAMDYYHGLVVNDNSLAVVGDQKLVWWKNRSVAEESLYVKGAIHVIDPAVYLKAAKIFKKLCNKPYPHDMYWDILPLLEEVNRRAIKKGNQSILQACIFDYPVVDYGTPELLETLRFLYYCD